MRWNIKFLPLMLGNAVQNISLFVEACYQYIPPVYSIMISIHKKYNKNYFRLYDKLLYYLEVLCMWPFHLNL